MAATLTLAACSSSSSSESSSEAASASASVSSAESSAAPEASESASTDAAAGTSQVGNPTADLCAGKEYTIGYDSFSDTAPGTDTFLNTINALAEKLGCVKIVHTVNNVDPTTALQNARSFVSQDVDAAIVFNAIAPNASGQVKIFKEAGIPVVQFGAFDETAPALLAPEFEAGKLAGTSLAEAFAAQFPGQTPYIIAGRNSGSGQPYIGYMDNFIEGAKSVFPGITDDQVLSLETTSDAVKAQQVVKGALAKVDPSAPVILMGNDAEVTYAMLKAVQAQGGRTGPVLSIDGRGQDATKGAVCDNPDVVGMINYKFDTWADYTIPLAILQAQGEEVAPVTETTVSYQPRSELCS